MYNTHFYTSQFIYRLVHRHYFTLHYDDSSHTCLFSKHRKYRHLWWQLSRYLHLSTTSTSHHSAESAVRSQPTQSCSPSIACLLSPLVCAQIRGMCGAAAGWCQTSSPLCCASLICRNRDKAQTWHNIRVVLLCLNTFCTMSSDVFSLSLTCI